MILGILADTHGRVEIAIQAIDMLLSRGAEFLIHCGDVGEGVLGLLPPGKSAFVFGNNDWDTAEMIEAAERLDVTCLRAGGVLTFEGKTVAVTHGDVPRLVNAYLASNVDYLLTGHTHIVDDHRSGNTRRINPGALHRAARKTVAILNVTTDELAFHQVA